MVVKGSDSSKLDYELKNIELEYEVIHNVDLARETSSSYLNSKDFMYEHVTHHKTLTVNKADDTIINESINVPHRSMKGILLLFCEPHAGGARDSEKFFNPDITNVKVSINGVPNKVNTRASGPMGGGSPALWCHKWWHHRQHGRNEVLHWGQVWVVH